MEIEVEPLAGALGGMFTMVIFYGRCGRKTWNNSCLDEQPGLSFDAPLVHHFQKRWESHFVFHIIQQWQSFCSPQRVAIVTRCFLLLGGGIRFVGQACKKGLWVDPGAFVWEPKLEVWTKNHHDNYMWIESVDDWCNQMQYDYCNNN